MRKERISFDEYALSLAQVASTRSEDPYVKVGACALRHDNSVAGLGYNGPPSGIDIDWSDRDKRRKYVIHAERNCLKYCKPGECSIIAVTLLPCASCMLDIASYGIKKVIFGSVYDRDKTALELVSKFEIELVQLVLP